MKEWFAAWFDTPYYHILYRDRDYSEAEQFIKNLFGFLEAGAEDKVLDLACGKGRHAHFVHSLGFDTTGVDLSAESIAIAQKMETNGLRFFRHDMREPLAEKTYDIILNLFTSFGYFDHMADNERVLNSVHASLVDDGILVIDFFNAEYVRQHLVKKEVKEVEGIAFEIEKQIENGFVIKDISFEGDRKKQHYQEKVQLLELADFEALLQKTGFEIQNIFGNYALENLSNASDRLILVAKKIAK